MFFLQLLKTQVSCSFIVAHVVVPGTGELQELGSLGAFDRYQFLLLSLAHVLKLTQHFLILEIVKFELGTPGLG